MAGKGKRKIIFQAPTGAGKTILFCGLVQRFLARYPDTRIIIAVHRKELLAQTVSALHRVAGIDAARIIAGHTNPVRAVEGFMVPHVHAKVIVGMVETLHNRFKKYVNFMDDVGLVIFDECHRGEFTKTYEHFPRSLIVGFTATPISADKRKPMKNMFEAIVAPVTIRTLIEQGHLAKNITIGVKNAIDRKKLKMKGNDFDEKLMGNIFSSPKHVQNTLQAYEKYCMGEKTIIFNCNIEHSQAVNLAFLAAGYNSRHMDSNATNEERDEILLWYAETDDAILQNVGIYTTGFDEPTIINVIMNRATASLTLWLQCCGRASRAIPDVKSHFKILDMGANEPTLLDWDYPHDWEHYFNNPEKLGAKKGVAPTKKCKGCEAMIHMSVKICPFCGYDHTVPQTYDEAPIDLVVLTKGIDIEEIIRKNQAYKPYRALHMIKGTLIHRFRQQYKHPTCSQSTRDILNERFQVLVKEWCREQGKPYDKKHKWMTNKWLMDELDRCYGKLKISSPQSAAP